MSSLRYTPNHPPKEKTTNYRTTVERGGQVIGSPNLNSLLLSPLSTCSHQTLHDHFVTVSFCILPSFIVRPLVDSLIHNNVNHNSDYLLIHPNNHHTIHIFTCRSGGESDNRASHQWKLHGETNRTAPWLWRANHDLYDIACYCHTLLGYHQAVGRSWRATT